jgi:hypothetical protein
MDVFINLNQSYFASILCILSRFESKCADKNLQITQKSTWPMQTVSYSACDYLFLLTGL